MKAGPFILIGLGAVAMTLWPVVVQAAEPHTGGANQVKLDDTAGGAEAPEVRHRMFFLVDRTRAIGADGSSITDGTSNTLMVGEKPPAQDAPHQLQGDQALVFYLGGIPQAGATGLTEQGPAQTTGSTFNSLRALGSVNDLFANRSGGDQSNRGGSAGPQIAPANGGRAELPAVQKVRDRDMCAPNCLDRSLQPPLGLAGNGTTANAPPPPPPPKPPASPLPVLLVIGPQDAPRGGKALTAPTLPGRASPVGANQTITIGGAKTR